MLRRCEQYWLSSYMSQIASGCNTTLTNVTFGYYGTAAAYIASSCQSNECQTRVISCYQRGLQSCLNVRQSNPDWEEWNWIWQCAPEVVPNFQMSFKIPTESMEWFCIVRKKHYKIVFILSYDMVASWTVISNSAPLFYWVLTPVGNNIIIKVRWSHKYNSLIVTFWSAINVSLFFLSLFFLICMNPCHIREAVFRITSPIWQMEAAISFIAMTVH